MNASGITLDSAGRRIVGALPPQLPPPPDRPLARLSCTHSFLAQYPQSAPARPLAAVEKVPTAAAQLTATAREAAGMANQLFVSKYQLELHRPEQMQRFLDQQLREVAP